MASVPVNVEYNLELKPLEALLSGVKRPGDFFVSGALETPMPRVEVEGVGVPVIACGEGENDATKSREIALEVEVAHRDSGQ